jgi:transmembrane sensor
MIASRPEKKKPPPAIRAQAAAWVARLHGPNRTDDVEAGLRRWLAESPEHAAAFELLTDTWEKSSRVRRRPIEHVAGWQHGGFRLSFSRAAFAAMAVAVLAVLGTLLYVRSDAVVTRIGEQRTLTLEDGSRVHLNTDTRAIVRYSKHARKVELEQGEALFEVAKRAEWPFIVLAGDREVRAIGTAFIVRRQDRDVSVTLVEGKVAVSAAGAESSAVSLEPGQRVTFASSERPRLDTPAIESATAWQRGQVALDNTPLADAVAEMNRYSATRIEIEDPAAAAIRISGIFRAGDSGNFVRAIARAYGLQVRNHGEALILAGSGRLAVGSGAPQHSSPPHP